MSPLNTPDFSTFEIPEEAKQIIQGLTPEQHEWAVEQAKHEFFGQMETHSNSLKTSTAPYLELRGRVRALLRDGDELIEFFKTCHTIHPTHRPNKISEAIRGLPDNIDIRLYPTIIEETVKILMQFLEKKEYHEVSRIIDGFKEKGLDLLNEEEIIRFLERKYKEAFDSCDIDVYTLRKSLGVQVDPSEIEDHEEKVQTIFIKQLREGGWKTAEFEEEFGQGMDLRTHPEFPEAAQEGFLRVLEESHCTSAKKWEEDFGKKMDIRKAKGYEEAVKAGIVHKLADYGGDGFTRDAKKFANEFYIGSDLEEAIKLGFINRMRRDGFYLEDFKKIREEWPSIDYSDHPEYEEAFRAGFLYLAKEEGTFHGTPHKLKEEWGEDIDCTEVVKEAFIYQLENAHAHHGQFGLLSLAEGDLKPEDVSGYKEALKAGILDRISHGDADWRRIEKMGEGFKLEELEGFEDTVRQGVFHIIKDKYNTLERIERFLGELFYEGFPVKQYITQLEGYAEAVREGLENLMDNCKRDSRAFTSKDIIAFCDSYIKSTGLDVSDILNSYCLGRLADDYRQTENVDELEKALGLKFDSTEGYQAALEKGFLRHLREGHIKEACDYIARFKTKAPQEIAGYKEALEQGFLEILKEGQAWEKVDEHRTTFNRFGVPLTGAIKKGFIESLKDKRNTNALEIFNRFFETVDCIPFDSFKDFLIPYVFEISKKDCENNTLKELVAYCRTKTGFVEVIESAFITALKKGDIEEFKTVWNLNKDINILLIEGYEEAVREGFLSLLKYGQEDKAMEFKGIFAKEMDLTKETKAGFLYAAQKEWGEWPSKDVPKKIGPDLDFTEEIIAAYMHRLKLDPLDASRFMEEYEECLKGVNPNEIEGYKEAVTEGYLAILNKAQLHRVVRIYDAFSDILDDVEKTKEYKQALCEVCNKLFPDFKPYLQGQNDNALAENLKNQFYVKQENNIDAELLLKFESLIQSAQHHISQALQVKLREWSLDPENPDYKTQLTDDQKLELRHLMAGKQADIRAKIQTIASPQLIKAYQTEQEGSEEAFLTPKAA